MALISPGVEVTVVDESFYVPGIPGAVPLVVVATAQNKTSGTGTGTAAGTLSTNANEIFLISSQRELTQTFGNPEFYTDASGTPIQGYELNEYGLQAAYSFLGIANRAFVIRANVDLAQLEGSAGAPGGTPNDGFYWLDLTASSWGIKEWNESTQSFTVKTPIYITSTDDVTGNAPKATKGSQGDYAVVATNPYNRLYYKTRSNTWVQVGSASSATKDGSWSSAHPTVRGTVTNPTLTNSESVTINGNTVTSIGTTVATFASAINSAGIEGVAAAAVNGKLELYSIPVASGADSSTLAVAALELEDTSGTPFADCGISTGTSNRHNPPKVFVGQHTEDHGFRSTDTRPRPSGSVWIQTTEPNGGANIVVKKYSTTTGVFETVNAPVYKTQEQALQQLDRAGGGSNLTTNDVFVQVNTTEHEWDDSTRDSGELIDYVAFVRSRGAGASTEIVSNKISDKTAAFTNGGTVTIRMAETILDIASTSPTGGGLLNQKTVSIGSSATDADDFVSAISAAGFENIEAEYDSTSKRITVRHTKGGQIYFTDNDTVMSDLGFNNTYANTYGGNLNLSSEKIAHLFTAPAGDKDDFSTVISTAGYGHVASNWTPVENTPDSGTTYTPIQSVNEPTKDPANDQYWYNTTVDEVDILIHNGSAWTGYQNVSSDARGFDLSATDPNGPQISATEPTTQSDGTALVDGDLWLDSSDLENYPKLYRYDSSQTSGQEWVLIDNTDQTSQDGILFADFRYHSDGTKDIISTETLITDLLTSTYTDVDAPDSALYPKGMLGFNLRRSGYNVKQFKSKYFTRTNFPSTTEYPTLPTETDAWVTASGLKANGAPYMGRKAQRNIIVEAMKSTVESTTELREEQREFNLLAAPGYPELITNLETLNADRKETAFVVGDTPFRLAPTSTEVTNWANNTAGAADNGEDGLVSSNSFTGVYYPSGFTTDLAGESIAVPPSHMMLRTIAFNDQVAFPWFAPAGVRRGAIDNASSVGYINAEGEFETTAVAEGLRDSLYSVNINPISFVTGSGLVAFGQKTRQLTASALDRINVARLVAFTRLQLDKIARPFIFEPNDALTRNEIKQAIESFLLELTSQRALFDFAVVCDETNNTPARIDRNELYVDVAIEPVKAVEFIFIPIRLKNTGEIAAQGL